MTDYWEPEALVARLVPCARVRIRLSGECERTYLSPNNVKGLTIAHLEGEQRKIGTIDDPKGRWRMAEAPWANSLEQGHRYLVAFDEPLEFGLRRYGAGVYAAIELEPLDEEVRDDHRSTESR